MVESLMPSALSACPPLHSPCHVYHSCRLFTALIHRAFHFHPSFSTLMHHVYYGCRLSFLPPYITSAVSAVIPGTHTCIVVYHVYHYHLSFPTLIHHVYHCHLSFPPLKYTMSTTIMCHSLFSYTMFTTIICHSLLSCTMSTMIICHSLLSCTKSSTIICHSLLSYNMSTIVVCSYSLHLQCYVARFSLSSSTRCLP